MRKNQKGSANVTLIAIIVALSGLVLYFAFVKKSEPVAQQSAPTPVATPTPKDETAGWKTLTSEAAYQPEYKLNLRYPNNWTTQCSMFQCYVASKNPGTIDNQTSNICYLEVDFPFEGNDWQIKTQNNITNYAQKQICERTISLIKESIRH